MRKKNKAQVGLQVPYKRTLPQRSLSAGLQSRFNFSPYQQSSQGFFPSYITASTNFPYTYGTLPYLNKRSIQTDLGGDYETFQSMSGDLSKDLRNRIKTSALDLGLDKGLGNFGNVRYQGTITPDLNLKQAFDPRNFSYTNQFGDEGIRGSLAFSPKNYATAEVGVGQNLSIGYNRAKDEQGRINTVTGKFNPGGPFSMEYSQQYRPGNTIMNQRVTGNINTDGFTASGYRNINQEEGKTYGGSFAKNTGPVTYGASANYGPQGLSNLNANLAAEDFYNLGYSRNRLDDGFENTINAGFNFNPFNINYSRTYIPGQEGSQTIGGRYQGEKGSFDISKNLSGENAGTYTGSLTKKIGNLNLSGSGSGTKQKVQDYKISAGLNIPVNKGTFDITGSYGRERDEMGNFGKPNYNFGLKYGYTFKKGGSVSKNKTKLKQTYFKKIK
jgi:hypothetical protein